MTSVPSEILIFNEQMRADRQYWQARLSPRLKPSNIWLDRSRTASAAEYSRFDFPFHPDLCLGLAQLAGDSAFLLYTAFVAALKICLQRYSGQNTIVIGSVSLRDAGNNASPNLIAVVDEVKDQMSFRNFLLQVRQTLLDAYAHQMYPLSQLVRDLGLEYNKQRNPLFDIVVTMADLHDEMSSMTADMKLGIRRSDGRIWVEVEYDHRLYAEISVSCMLRCVSQLMESGLKTPDASLNSLKMTSAAEEQQVLEEWNRTEKTEDKLSVVDMFEEQARRNPRGEAVVYEEEARISYGELNQRANQLARYLKKKGVEKETLVAVVMEQSVEMVVGLLGVLKAGGAYVPVDPAYPQERIRYMLEDVGARIVLTQERSAPAIADAEFLVLDNDWEQFSNESVSNLENHTVWENLAYVIYTSGSSGSPKGVEITHKGLSNLIDWYRGMLQVTPQDRATLLAAPAFDASVLELWPILSGGACLYIPDHQTRSYPPKLVSWLAARKITVSFLPTSLVEPVLKEIPAAPVVLRSMTTGGERLRSQCVNTIPFSLINLYGPTENTVVSTFAPVVDEGEKDPPIGKPMANVQAYVLDEHLHPLPVGVPGELFIGGVGLARGYHKKPELTAERFIPDPFGHQPGARLYRTGDFVRYRRDGQLDFIGRRDNQVKVSGYRIELGEVEFALEHHPGVSQCVVLVRNGPAGGNRLVAYVVGNKKQKLSASELRSYLRDRLPHFMIPSAFVYLDALPLTAHGKIDRKALPDAPDRWSMTEGTTRGTFSPIEELVARVYGEVLNAADIGVEDNFFALGGNSLHATQTMSRINNLLQVETPLQNIFEAPTVAELAAKIESRLSGGTNAASPGDLLKRDSRCPNSGP